MKGLNLFFLILIIIFGMIHGQGVSLPDDDFVYDVSNKLNLDGDTAFEVYRIEILLNMYSGVKYDLTVNMYGGGFIIKNDTSYTATADTSFAVMTIDLVGVRLFEKNFTGTATFNLDLTRTNVDGSTFAYAGVSYTEVFDTNEFQAPDVFIMHGSEQIIFYDLDTNSNVTGDCGACVDEVFLDFEVNVTTATFLRIRFVTDFATKNGLGSEYLIKSLSPGLHTISLSGDATGFNLNSTEWVDVYIYGEILSSADVADTYFTMDTYTFNQYFNTSNFEFDAFKAVYNGFEYIDADVNGEAEAIGFDFTFTVGKTIDLYYYVQLLIKIDGVVDYLQGNYEFADMAVGEYNKTVSVNIGVLYGNTYDTAFSMKFYSEHTTAFKPTMVNDNIGYNLQFNTSKVIQKPTVHLSGIIVAPKYNYADITDKGYDFAEITLDFDVALTGVFNGTFTVWSGEVALISESISVDVFAPTSSFVFYIEGYTLYNTGIVGSITFEMDGKIYSDADPLNYYIAHQVVNFDIDYSVYNPAGSKGAPRPDNASTTPPTSDSVYVDTGAGKIPLPSVFFFFISVITIAIIRRKIC